MGLGAYMSTLLLVKLNVSPWISIPLVFLFVGALTALLLSPCFVLRGPYFSLVTIAFGEAFRNLMTNWDFAGKGQGLLLPFGDNSLALLRFKSKVPYFYLSLLMVIAVYLIVRAIDRSKFGYALKTVREDEDTANAIGINPLKYKVLATFVSCGLIAVCGVFYANYIRFINPDIMIQAQSVEFVLPDWSYYSYTVSSVSQLYPEQYSARSQSAGLRHHSDCGYPVPAKRYYGLV